jgi:uncharacterized membrane protein YbhN (UPF0104 family)
VGARERLTTATAALRARPRLLAGVQVVAVVALLAFFAIEFSGAVRDAWPRLRDADVGLVVLALVLMAAYYLLFVLGWQRILRDYDIHLGYRAVLGAEMVSMLAKYIPGGVWTPAARIVAVRRSGVDDTSTVLATMAIEAGYCSIGGVVVLAASLPFVSGVDAPVWPVVAFGGLLLVILHPRVFAPLATRVLRPFGGGEIAPLPWGTAILVLLFYSFTWLIGGAALTALLASVGGHPGVAAIPYLGGAGAVGAIVAVVTVIFPSGLGVREGAMAAFMLALAPDGAVVGAVVLNRLAITVVEALLLAGAASLRGRRRSYPAPR